MIKKFDELFEDEAPKNSNPSQEVNEEEKFDATNELKEAFMRYLLNTAGIKPENVTGVDAYNKYVLIRTVNDDEIRIDFTKKYTGM